MIFLQTYAANEHAACSLAADYMRIVTKKILICTTTLVSVLRKFVSTPF